MSYFKNFPNPDIVMISYTVFKNFYFFTLLKKFFSSSALAAITRYLDWSGLNNRYLFLTILEARKSKIKMLALNSWWELSFWLANGHHFYLAERHMSSGH